MTQPPRLAPLTIEIVKRADGGAVLRCTRADGSSTWQRLGGAQAGFFPMHDLTHVAVETTLGTTEGFFGLVSAGWDIDQTTGMGARGPLPLQALLVERIVGMLDVERATGSRWSAADFAEQITAADPRLATLAARLADDDFDTIRSRRALLFTRWEALALGGTLSLPFPATAAEFT